MFPCSWEAEDQKMRKCVCETWRHSHSAWLAWQTLWVPGCPRKECSLTSNWHQWCFVAKMSPINFTESPAYKRSWCLIKNTFLEVKDGRYFFREELLCILFLICYFKMAVWTFLQSKRYLLKFSLIMTCDPQQVKYDKIRSKRHYILRSQPAENFQDLCRPGATLLSPCFKIQFVINKNKS